MGNPSRHLRFSPDEYRLLASVWLRLDLGGRPRTDLKRLLAEALSGPSPDLAERISHLCEAEVWLLREHFRERAPSAEQPEFTAEELRLVMEMCVSIPIPARYVRRFKGVLVEFLEEAWPELSRKVARLSGQQFKRLHEQAVRQGRGRGRAAV